MCALAFPYLYVREKESVCMCVGVCKGVRKRERERERGGGKKGRERGGEIEGNKCVCQECACICVRAFVCVRLCACICVRVCTHPRMHI